ncbi:RNA methyltransferase [Mucilaginibacter sp. UR6-1]|uniref:methyltransferase RsmF C-terminal domain-like protein n=1 Tax=Mucilaginibacter sp. UR6-1 TaxID=1435643 RepID=UPI001E33D3C5|nr:RNA methyltransferase [Mucilaginibacter sp. UR6-1]MCC8410297.1 RNA methyltransferase [Mucilaginibacter sp. UR6-1]
MNNVSFPPNFVDSLRSEPGFDEQSFVNAHQNDAPVSVRVNPFKPSNIKKGPQVPWCNEGFYLNKRPSFTFDPLFHAGAYYVQEASSMFIGHIFNYIKPDGEPVKVLDLCAAPGGKSTLLNSLLNNTDLLVANEIIKTRVPVLTDNLARWGTANSIVTNNDPRDFSRLKGFFDIILVDAPCSGSGMFRKDNAAMGEWSEANVDLCHQRQQRILADVYPALKEDGYLIYSTCSYSHQENEDVLDWLCSEFEMESVNIPVDTDWNITVSQSSKHGAYGYRFYPGKIQGEGLFAACLKKTTDSGQLSTYKNNAQQKLPAGEMELVKQYINNADDFYYFKVADDWLAIDRHHHESLNILHKNLYIKKSGVRIGKIAGHDLVPDHELALSTIINKDVVLQTELNYDEAIAYLRKDNLVLDTQDKGWSLMSYEGLALGWAKLLPNRVNNYYPKELRILASSPPTP